MEDDMVQKQRTEKCEEWDCDHTKILTMWFNKGEEVVLKEAKHSTAYSSWACSFRHEYKKNPKNPEKIMCRTWKSQSISLKAPTAILVQDDGITLDKFGYEAEDKYAVFAEAEADELRTWFYFKQFKMILHDKKIRRDMKLKSENGKEVPALRVFTLTIEYLKNDLLDEIGIQMMNVLDKSQIRWILTVPAIWDESAKQFMREAAVEAGIPSNQLTLAIEAEVASLYCNTIPLASPDDDGAGALHSGAKYVLIDAGGGTVDIIAHEVMNDGSLNEIYQSNGGPWDSTEVDKEYFNFLRDLIGNSVYDNFKKQHMEDYIYLCREFEQKKKTIKPDDVSKVTTPLPGSLKNLFENEKRQDLATSIMSSDQWSEDVALVSDKIRMAVRIMKGFFVSVLKYISDYLQLIFSGDSLKDVSTIMMVGGFSESKMLQEMVQNLFPEKMVIVPPQAGLAVLKGAVLFGHNPAVIGHRVCRFSYGVKSSLKFENGKHREDKRKTWKDLCVDIFDIHIHKGQSVKLNAKQVPMVYKPQKPGQKIISLKFYSSCECYPMYVTDEGCMELGKITVDVLGEPTMDNAVEVSFKFGGTEIQVEAIDKKTGKATNSKVDFLE